MSNNSTVFAQSTASTSPSPKAAFTAFWAPMARARRRCCARLLGIIDPDEGARTLLGSDRPITQSRNVGYLPEERGLYQSMRAVDTIAFMGALRGMPLKEAARKGSRIA